MNKIKFIILTLSAALINMSSYAQDIEKKEFLPKKGEYSIGINADPLFNFVGNLFNGTVSQNIGEIGGSVLAPSNNRTYFPNVSIMGKYMITDNFAARVNIGFIINSATDATYSLDDNAAMLDPLSQAKVKDIMKESRNGGSISLGLEYRIGTKKIQGVFGGNIMYAYSSSSQAFTYGNAITPENQKPSITTKPNWNNDYVPLPGISNARSTKHSATGFHSVGFVGSIGIEWFVAPKISLGAEVNLALIYTFNPSIYSEYEGYNEAAGEVQTYTNLNSPSTYEFTFGTQNIGGNISVNFYF